MRIRSRSWNGLDPRLRQALLAAGAVDAGLRIAALIDLARRPAAAVVGRRRWWVTGLLVVSSFGLLPVVYLLRGRR